MRGTGEDCSSAWRDGYSLALSRICPSTVIGNIKKRKSKKNRKNIFERARRAGQGAMLKRTGGEQVPTELSCVRVDYFRMYRPESEGMPFL